MYWETRILCRHLLSHFNSHGQGALQRLRDTQSLDPPEWTNPHRGSQDNCERYWHSEGERQGSKAYTHLGISDLGTSLSGVRRSPTDLPPVTLPSDARVVSAYSPGVNFGRLILEPNIGDPSSTLTLFRSWTSGLSLGPAQDIGQTQTTAVVDRDPVIYRPPISVHNRVHDSTALNTYGLHVRYPSICRSALGGQNSPVHSGRMTHRLPSASC